MNTVYKEVLVKGMRGRHRCSPKGTHCQHQMHKGYVWKVLRTKPHCEPGSALQWEEVLGHFHVVALLLEQHHLTPLKTISCAHVILNEAKHIGHAAHRKKENVRGSGHNHELIVLCTGSLALHAQMSSFKSQL